MMMRKITKEDIQELEIAVNEMHRTLIREGKLRQGSKDAVPGMNAWPALNNNNNPYTAYRFGIAMAGAPDIKTDKSGPNGGDFITLSYTDGDDEILNSAAKQMGIKSSSIAAKKSKETDDVHRVSPVANKKRNRYGV
jgi:hypothetical protein